VMRDQRLRVRDGRAPTPVLAERHRTETQRTDPQTGAAERDVVIERHAIDSSPCDTQAFAARRPTETFMNIPQIETPLYIAGSWRPARGPAIDVFDPRNETTLAAPRSATDDDVHSALSAARIAQRDWAHTPAAARGRFIRAAADLVHTHRDSFARLISQ